MKELFPNITVDAGVQFGKPVIAGTRVPVETVLGHIAAGDTIEQVMNEYDLRKEQIMAALKYVAKIISEETVMVK